MWPFTGGCAIGVDCASDAAALRILRSEMNLGYPLVLDDRKTIFSLYEVGSASTYLIVDALGVIRYRKVEFDQRTIFSQMRMLLSQ
jgi:hypothetical protein